MSRIAQRASLHLFTVLGCLSFTALAPAQTNRPDELETTWAGQPLVLDAYAAHPRPAAEAPTRPRGYAGDPNGYTVQRDGAIQLDRAKGAYNHDGFLLRAGLGIGGMSMNRQASVGSDLDGSSGVRGGAGSFELTLGGTPYEGLVLGGSLLGFSHDEAVLVNDDGTETELGEPLGFWMLGFTGDWYPDPEGGFHVGATLGVAAVGVPDGDGSPRIGGAGVGASLLAGYDFWIAEQWSLGAQARVASARYRREEAAGLDEGTVNAFGLAFVGTYH